MTFVATDCNLGIIFQINALSRGFIGYNILLKSEKVLMIVTQTLNMFPLTGNHAT